MAKEQTEEFENGKEEELIIHRVGSFRFDHAKDKDEAEKEHKNIESLKQKIDFTKTGDMMKLYTRLVERDVFHTEVGYQFMAEFREYLVEQGGADGEGGDLPLVHVKGSSEAHRRMEQEQIEYLTKENAALKTNRNRYLILVIALAVVILALFIIAAVNPNVGYINTENKILSKYASWEEDLTRREREVSLRETELGIDSNQQHLDTESTEE